MRGQLLDHQAYQQILTLPDISAMVGHLMESSYGLSLGSVGEAVTDVARVEEGLRRNFSATLTKLCAISGEECREEIRLLLGYWDVQNLITILRGKNALLPAGEVLPSLVPAGLYDEAALEELCRQPDLHAVANLLVTWMDPYGRPLFSALKEYREPRDLFLLETAISRLYYERAVRQLKEIRPAGGEEDPLSVYLGLTVDRTNLMTALKVVEEQMILVDSHLYFLPGGRVYSENTFAQLLTARTLQDALEIAARSFFEEAVRNLPDSSGRIARLSLVERRLDRVLLRRMRAMMRTNPLGMATVVSYLLDKVREITNLRMIVRGRLVSLPDEDLSQLLILEN